MRRFKTVGATQCGQGHFNLFDERILAESVAEARRSALKNAVNGKCTYCASALTLSQAIQVETKEISLHLEYTIFGYTCSCRERVEVERVEKERSVTPPAVSKTVSCSKGHSRTIRNQEYPTLQSWEEKTN
jgi:hypothetical protein